MAYSCLQKSPFMVHNLHNHNQILRSDECTQKNIKIIRTGTVKIHDFGKR